MKAKVIYTSTIDGTEVIEINGHKIQFGYDRGGDGFCYVHDTFQCIDNLTEEEWYAIKNAKEEE